MYERVKGIKLAYNEYGSGQPCLMLHGNRDKKENFNKLANELSKECNLNIFTIDFRGHGDSEKPETGYTIDNFVEDIVAFIKNKNLQKVILIGHSLGSTVSMVLVDKYAELIDKLILMGAAVEFKIKFKRPQFTKENFKKMIKQTNQRVAPYFFVKEFKQVKEQVLNNWSNIEFHVHMNMIKLKHPDLRQIASRIIKKTLLIYGEKDCSTTINDGEILNKFIKKSQLTVIEGCGHFMYLEKPNVVIEEIRKFLNGEKDEKKNNY